MMSSWWVDEDILLVKAWETAFRKLAVLTAGTRVYEVPGCVGNELPTRRSPASCRALSDGIERVCA